MAQANRTDGGKGTRSGAGYTGRLLGYGLGDLGLNIYWNSLSLLLVYWYTSVAGMEPAQAGLIYSIGLVWDAISDPAVAGVAERTRSRFGSYRPYIGFGSVVLGASFCLLFWVPPVGEGLVFWVLLATNIVFRTCYTFVAVPYAALSSRITFNSEERADLTGVRMTLAFIGQLAVASLAFPFARYFAERQGEEWGFFYAAAIGAMAATVVLLACAALTRELKPNVPPDEPVSFRSLFGGIIAAITRNTALRVLMVVIFFNIVGGTMQMIPLAYYVKANGDLFVSVERVMTAYAIATIAGSLLCTLALHYIGKRSCWYIAAGVQMLAGLSLLLLGPVVAFGAPLQFVIYGLCGASYAVITWAMVPNIVEYGQHAYGKRAEGAVFGSFLLVQKSSGALAGIVVGVALSWIGFSAGAVEPEPGIARNLEICLALGPPIASVLAGVAFSYMPLNRKVHADIVGELAIER